MTPEIKYVFEIPFVKKDYLGIASKPATQKDINHLQGVSDNMSNWYDNTIRMLEELIFYGVKFKMKHHTWCKEHNINPFYMSDSEQTQFKLTFGDEMK